MTKERYMLYIPSKGNIIWEWAKQPVFRLVGMGRRSDDRIGKMTACWFFPRVLFKLISLIGRAKFFFPPYLIIICSTFYCILYEIFFIILPLPFSVCRARKK